MTATTYTVIVLYRAGGSISQDFPSFATAREHYKTAMRDPAVLRIEFTHTPSGLHAIWDRALTKGFFS